MNVLSTLRFFFTTSMNILLTLKNQEFINHFIKKIYFKLNIYIERYKRFIDVESVFSRSKFDHALYSLTIISETVSISVKWVSVAIAKWIVAVSVSTQVSWFRRNDTDNDSQQQDCVLYENNH